MIRKLLICLTLTVSLSGVLLAQGSGSMPDPGKKESPFRVSKTVSGKALDGTSASRIVMRQGDERITLRITKDTKIEAERGADVKDEKRPAAADIKAGTTLRVLYYPDKNEAAEVMILKGAS